MEYILKPKVHLSDEEKAAAGALGGRLSLDGRLTEILYARGINTAEKIERFLAPSVSDLLDPFAFRDMEKAAALIRQAIENGERIWIHGDYDADGTSGAALLWRTLRHMGAAVSCFIPDRGEHGYGLTEEVIRSFRGSGLLITVDCGTAGVKEIALARSLGMKTIVTDHHTCPEELPAADALLNPKAPGETYPFRELCGAGVAFKLSQALIGEEALQYADLAAFGTIADLVPLREENRTIASLGLRRLNEDPNPGLLALSRELGLGRIDAETVAFRLAPCINAAGRMASAVLAFNLLAEDAAGSAGVLAKALSRLNSQRQARQKEITEEVEKRIASMEEIPAAIVLWDAAWETGLVGLAAGHVAEKYGRPAVLLGERDGVFVGSARGVPEFDVYAALESLRPLFVKFGGHTGAAGLTIEETNLEKLQAGLCEYAGTHLKGPGRESTEYDMEISLPADPALLEMFSRLEPCGQENPQPRVLVRRARLRSLRGMGGGRHAGFQLHRGQGALEAVMFRTAPEEIPAQADVVGTLRKDPYHDGAPQMIVSAISEEEETDALFVELAREVCADDAPAEPWRFFRKKPRMGVLYSAISAQTEAEGPQSWRRLYHGICRRVPDAVPEEIVFAVCVFTQLKLLEGAKDGKIKVIRGGPKRDLSGSSIYRKFRPNTENN